MGQCVIVHNNELSNPSPRASGRIRIGVSACLLGEPVRFDSGHQRDHFVVDNLARYFELVPICPEVAIGLGVPREPIHLVGSAQSPRAVGTRNALLDVTEPLAEYGRRMARELGDISGYLFKSKSPSCGTERVKVHGHSGAPRRIGRGIYAAEIMRANPLLPVEEEGRLNEPMRRESFIERLYAYRRWQNLMKASVTREALIEFHARHRLVLIAHGLARAEKLERLVAQAKNRPIEPLAAEYGASFMSTLHNPANRWQHTEALLHAMSYLKRHLDSRDQMELVNLIHAYREERVPRVMPIALLRRHFQRHPEPEISNQVYLSGQPAELCFWSDI